MWVFKMERILHCLPGNLDVGGIENFIINVNRYVDKTNYRFDYIVHKKDKNFYEDEVNSLGGKIYRLPNKSKDFIEYRKQFIEVAKNYNIIHIHSVYAFTFFETYWAKKMGVKVILHSHNSSASFKRKMLHYTLKNSQDRYIDLRLSCSSAATKWMFRKRNQNKTVYIRNGFDIQKYRFNKLSRDELREFYNIGEKNIVLGNTSRFSAQKNPLFTIDIFNKLYLNDDRYRLVLVGEGDLKKEIENKIKELKLIDVVKVIDGVKNVEDYLSMFDLFIFPSLYEGLGISLLEAQINGLNCLISQNIPEEAMILKKKIFILSNEHIEEWQTCILNINFNESRLVSLEEFQDFDVKSVVKEMEKNYFKLLN